MNQFFIDIKRDFEEMPIIERIIGAILLMGLIVFIYFLFNTPNLPPEKVRTVKMYSMDGKLIQEYPRAVHIRYREANQILFKQDGKQITVNGTFVIE